MKPKITKPAVAGSPANKPQPASAPDNTYRPTIAGVKPSLIGRVTNGGGNGR